LGDVFACLLGGKNNLAMLLRGQADSQPAGEGLLWHFPALSAKRQIVLNRVGECLTEFLDGLPLKRHNIPDVDDLTVEKIRLLIEGHMGKISFVCHHGSITHVSVAVVGFSSAPLAPNARGEPRARAEAT